MENILTPQDKISLQLISKYLRSNGLKEGTIEIDMDYGELRPDAIENFDFFTNSYNVEIPDEFISIVKKILVYMDENEGLPAPDVEDINYERLMISLDAIGKQLTIEHFYSYYDESETDSNSWTQEDYEDFSENQVTQIFKSIEDENPNLTPKEGMLTLRYNGSGDSGYIEDYFEEGGSVPSYVADWCYQQLENLHGGWEINEGSSGEFKFDIKNNLVELYHTFNIEESESKTVYEEKF